MRDVGALQPRTTVWDAAVVGFGARRQRGTKVSYFVVYRTAEGRQRLITIGRQGSPWTPDTARQEALRVLGEVARGGDPMADRRARRSAAAMSVADLCDRYLADAAAGRLLTRHRRPKKPSTIKTDRSRVEAHIRPLLGAVPVSAVTREDVERMMRRIIDGEARGRATPDGPRAPSAASAAAGARPAGRSGCSAPSWATRSASASGPTTRSGAWRARRTGSGSGGCGSRNTRRSAPPWPRPGTAGRSGRPASPRSASCC